MPEKEDPNYDGNEEEEQSGTKNQSPSGYVFSAAVRSHFTESQLAELSQMFAKLEKKNHGLFKQLVRGGKVNLPDIRRFWFHEATSGYVNSASPQLKRQFNQTGGYTFETRNPDYAGPQQDEEGEFKYGDRITGGYVGAPDEIKRIMASLSPDQLKKYFRGSGVGMIDLRRLYRGKVLSPEDQEWLRQYLVKNRLLKDDTPAPDPTDPPPKPNDPGTENGPPPLPDGGGKNKNKDRDSDAPPYQWGDQNDPEEFEFDQGLWNAMKGRIMDTLKNPGYDPEIMENSRNTQRAATANQIRDMKQNAAERLAERGISDSGLAERTYQDIESGARETLADNLGQLDMENAQAALQAVQMALQGGLGLNAQQLDKFQLELQAEMQAFAEMAHKDNVLLSWFQMKINEHLAQGQLDLNRLYYELAYDESFWRRYLETRGIPDLTPEDTATATYERTSPVAAKAKQDAGVGDTSVRYTGPDSNGLMGMYQIDSLEGPVTAAPGFNKSQASLGIGKNIDTSPLLSPAGPLGRGSIMDAFPDRTIEDGGFRDTQAMISQVGNPWTTDRDRGLKDFFRRNFSF